MIDTMQRVFLVAGLALAATFAPSFHAAATTTSPASAVLRQESRWLRALLTGDRDAVAALLSANYEHIDSTGRLYDRAEELAGVTKEPVTMKWTGQSVELVGGVAVVHGLNTLTRSGKTTQERYTDVYVNQNGTWMALSAQETAIAR